MDQREAKNFIVNNRWKTFNSVEMGLVNNEDRLIRVLRDIREHEFYAIASYLKYHADPKNAAHSATVVDPVVDSQTMAGTWRHLSCYMVRTDANGRETANGQHFNLVQELRRGFLTTLNHAEARLVGDKMNPGDGVGGVNVAGEKYITLQWNAVDPDLIDSLVEGKISPASQGGLTYRRAIVGTGEAATVSIDGTGFTYYLLNIGTEMGEDGTGVVRVMYGDTDYVLTGQMSYLGSKQTGVTYYYNVPEALAQGILDAALARGVDAVPTGHDHQLGLVNIRVSVLDLTGVTLTGVKLAENCDETVTADFHWGTGDSTLLPIPDTIPAGTSYDRSLTENGDGSFSIVLRKTVRKYRNITEYGAEFRADQDTARKEWKGVTTQDLSGDLIEVAGKVVRVQRNVREDCSVDVVRDTITPADQTTTSGEDRADQSVTVTEHTQANAAVTAPPTRTAGTLARVANRETEFGKFATREEVTTAKAQTTTHTSESRADQTASRVVAKNAGAKADATAVTGKVVRASSAENEFGLFDNTVETVTPANQTATGAEIRADRTAETDTATQADAEADDTPVAGKIVQTQNSPTEFGKYRTSRTVVTPIDQTGEQAEIRADRTSETETHTEADVSPDASPISGKIVQTTEQPTEFGKKRTSRTVVTPLAQTVTHDSEDSAARSTERTVATNANAKADAPTAAAGEVTRAQSRENEFGKFDNTVEVVTAKAQTTTHLSTSRADQTAERVVEQNAAAKADATAVAGKVVNAQSRENEFGRFDNMVETITPVNQTTTSGEVRADQASVVVENTQAAAAETTPPTRTAGELVRVQNKETEFGKFATRKETITAAAQTTTYLAETRADQTVDTVKARNAAAKADATAVTGKVVRASSAENEFGRFDNQVDTITPALLTTGWQTFDHPYGTAGVLAAVNASDSDLTTIKGELTTQAAAGKTTSLNPRKNEFGLWDITASYTPKSAGGARVSSTDWNNFGVEVDEYPAVTDQYNTAHRLCKVFRIMTSSQATCQSFWEGNTAYTVDPSPDGYTIFPSYRGLQSVTPQYLGDGRWTAHRVMVEDPA